jgi:hypothetical protein
MAIHGIRSVPKLPASQLHPQVADLLNQMRDAIVQLQGSKSAPNPVTNISITPLPGGNRIQFTKSDADSYTLFWSDTPNFGESSPIDLGIANSYNDNFGLAGMKRYYWIKPKRIGGQDGRVQGPLAGISLALGTVANPTPTIPPSQRPAETLATGQNAAGYVKAGKYTPA